MTAPSTRHRNQPLHIRVLNRFFLVYKPAERPDKRIIENVVNGQHIGWAIKVGPWLISTGTYL